MGVGVDMVQGAGGRGRTKGMERFFVCAHNSIELTKKKKKGCIFL